jgi:hypothetical protein
MNLLHLAVSKNPVLFEPDFFWGITARLHFTAVETSIHTPDSFLFQASFFINHI